jgi:hypothetical protein
MTNRQFAAAVVMMIDDPSAYRRCSVQDLVLISAVLGVVVDGIEKELESRKKHPRLRIVK